MESCESSVRLSSWDGTISSGDFYVASCAFAELWSECNAALPQWSWVNSRKKPWSSAASNDEGYLSLENLVPFESAEEDDCEGSSGAEDECSCSNEEGFIDDAVLVETCSSARHHYDFHIVYSSSYKVPVLYVRAYYSDGRPLVLDDIEKDISANSSDTLRGNKWTFVTMEDHPYLNRPWCMLHPCGTSKWMKLLFSAEALTLERQAAVRKYLVSWFSVVGQIFGFKFPFKISSNLSNLG